MTETNDTNHDTPRAVAELRPERLGQSEELPPERLGSEARAEVMNTPRPVPVSYAGRDSIHVHGGLLYSGDHLPDEESFRAWADRLEAEASTHLNGLGETELRTVFHLVFRQDEEPRFEVHAEVQALLGRRTRHGP